MEDQALYPDALAEQLKSSGGESYRPSNGSEGWAFQSRWCDRCKGDENYSDTKPELGCQILLRSLCCNIGEPGYPTEWIYGDDGVPKCTAFIPQGE